MTLLQEEVQILRKANKALAKCWRAKKTCIRASGALTIEDALSLIEQKNTAQQQPGRRSTERGAVQAGPSSLRRCGRCGKTGHNIRTCQEAENTSDEESVIVCS